MAISKKHNQFLLEIITAEDQQYKMRVLSEINGDKSIIAYSPLTKSLIFCENTDFSQYLRKHEHQLRKMLHNKRLDTFFIGFKLHFILWENKDVKQFSDRSKIIVLDRRTTERIIFATNIEDSETTKVYTDGSFLEKKGKGGYVVLIKRPNKNYQLHTYESGKKSSALIELEAAIKALEILKDVEKIRIISDSQYVRKGLTEWVPIWELNDWCTVNGVKAKNIGYWKYFDSLSKGKYLEFEWVKAHDNHFENTLCDLYAKMQASA